MPGASSVGAMQLIASFDMTLFLVGCWSHFVQLARSGQNILAHPNYVPGGPHFYIYDPALIDVATASYVDVTRILDEIQLLRVDGKKKSFKVMFVVGDQQTYDRMCVLLIDHPMRFNW